jgi:LPXTG-motif cell wall-anchored protein
MPSHAKWLARAALLPVLFVLLGGVVAIYGVSPAGAAPAAQTGPATWTVLTGGQAEMSQQEAGLVGAWQFMRYYPQQITIDVGDTVLWKQSAAEPHTVTFLGPGDTAVPELIVPEGGTSQRLLLNPLAVTPQGGSTYDGSALTSSGQMGFDPSLPTEYKLTFTKVGTFEYYCAFHSMMTGTVVVQAAGTAYPKTQSQLDSDAAAQLADDTKAALAAEPPLLQPATSAGANGTVHQVRMGYGDGTMAWLRFGPADITVNAGDTVEWTEGDVETPHTVTFVSGGTEPEFALTENQASGPPKIVLNPEVVNPAGGSTYSGTGYFSSGVIWGTKVPMSGPRTYSLTFDKPGTYPYVCALHDTVGMKGTVTVLASGEAAAPAQLPKTGGASGRYWPLWFALLGLALVTAGITARRRRPALTRAR